MPRWFFCFVGFFPPVFSVMLNELCWKNSELLVYGKIFPLWFYLSGKIWNRKYCWSVSVAPFVTHRFILFLSDFFLSKALSKIWTLLKKLWTTKLCKWIWIKISFKRKNIDSKFLLRDLAGLCYTTCYTWLNPNDFWFIALSEIWTLLKKFQATKLRKKILNSNFI